MAEETAAERIAKKRLKIEQERREIQQIEQMGREALAERQLEIEEEQLDRELRRLQAEKMDAIRTAGGSVAEALAVMDEAAAIQRPPLGGATAPQPSDKTEGEGN